MEVPDTSATASESDEITNDESQTEEDVRILSVDKITVEKIVLESKKTREVLVTKSESSKKVSALRYSFLAKSNSGNKTEHSVKPSELSPTKNSRFRAGTSPCIDKKVSSNSACKPSKLPISRTQKSGSFTSLNEKRISPIKLTKCSSIGSLLKVSKSPKTGSVVKPRKVPPKVPQKPTKAKLEAVRQRSSDIEALSAGKSNTSDVKDQRVEASHDSIPEVAKGDERGTKISDERQTVATNVSSDASQSTSLESEEKSNQQSKASSSEEINPGTVEVKLEEKSEDRTLRSDQEVPGENVTRANGGFDEVSRSSAQDRLEKSQNEIERLQQNLCTKIHASTVEKYKQKLPSLQTIKVSPIIDLNQNDKIVTSFDSDFLQNRRLNKELKIEEKQQYPDNADLSDLEKSPEEARKPKYSKKVLEIEKRWSGEYLDQNSSESSKSSYIEELGSISSHESIVLDQKKVIPRKLCQKREGNFSDDRKPHSGDEILEDTVSTVDSDSCFEDRIKDIECDIQHGEERGSVSKLSCNADFDEENESKESTLKETSSVRTCLTDDSSTLKDNEDCLDSVASKEALQDTGKEHREISNIEEKRECLAEEARNPLNCPDKDVVDTGEINSVVKKDGYATFIQEFTMDPGTSKSPKDEKKKKGLLRLLPGLFSPSKESRKEHKKDSKDERRGKRREDRHFTQHQQNGNYTRSPDTMNLNEDIKRNVKLDTSLNSSIIEERLNEIKQELFPEQGLITSTPDHFLQTDRGYQRHQRSAGNSSANYIAEEKWIDQNIISGSPDLRKFKQRRNDKCHLERKHSLQESQNQSRFQRNHGPTGRISAPPCERFLIRPRAIHPIDRPLPAIPQKVEFVNYENHEEMSKNSMRQKNTMNYPTEPYIPENCENQSHNVLYENGNQYNLAPVSAQVKITRQAIVNQNQRAPLTGRSPKYSPTSQKSDYADSSYTPNSSQNEFSPSSSKSGEYYLYSPRNSSQLSNESFGEKREQIYENEQSSKAEERLYDETPTSDSPKDKSPSRSLNNSEHIYGQRSPANIPLSSNLAKMRANVSDEDVKDDLEDKTEKTDERITSPVTVTLIADEATNASNDNETRTQACGEHGLKPSTQGVGLRVTSPSQMQRMASPLTIVTNNIQRQSPLCHSKDLTAFPSLTPVKDIKGITPTSMSTRIPSPRSSPRVKDSETSPPRIVGASPSNLSSTSLSPTHGKETMPRAMSPKMAGSPHRSSPASLTNRRDLLGSSPLATEGTSPKEMCLKRSGTPTSPANHFTPTCVLQGTRRSQPNDQILIASPKKDHIYDSYGRLELGCPDSPVPMADSPSQVLGSKQSLRPTTADRADGCKSPSVDRAAGKPDTVYGSRQSVRSPVNQRTMSPVRSVQAIQRPEPIYIRREKTLQSPIPKDSISRNEHSKEEVKGRSTMGPERSVSAKQQGVAHHRALSPNTGQISAQRQTIPRSQGSKSDRREDAQDFYQDYGCNDCSTDGKQLPSSPNRMDCQDFAGKPALSERQPIYMKKQEVQNQIYESRVVQEGIYGQRMQKVESCSDHRISDPKQLSPSKKQTMQHLEAFYWQQKALEAQRTSMTSPTNVAQQNQPQLPKIDMPEVREVVYWQQLKKLDEEQQRKIFEQNMMEARNDPEMRRNAPIPPAIRHGSSSSLTNPSTNPHLSEQIYWRTHQQQAKAQPVGKPPLGQKGQNQPVLVVRPQQADRLRKPEVIDGRLEVPRSKSVSPHFTRSDERRSLSLPRKVLNADNVDDGGFSECNREKNIAALRKPESYEEELESDRKAPPPIFKRGSLISNSSNSVDYGSMGPKRVSFSNQSNCLEVGNWPTKHGMAPEPPTRKHKSESVPESAFYHEQEHQVYGNIPMRLPPGERVPLASQDLYGNRETLEKEYDANKPLPPPPRESSWSRPSAASAKDRMRNENVNCVEYQRLTGPIANPRKWTGVCDSESGSEASEVQRIFQRRNEEEWNPDGKGRQSNDAGGGRVEGDQSSNEVVGGRRGVGTPGGGGSILGGGGGSRGTPTGTGRSRDEPRRHTLSGDHQPSLHHQQFGTPQLHPLHPHHLPPPHSQYGTPPSRHTMDLEMGTKSRQRKSPLPRGYPPPSSAMLFDDDPGIMSEVETSSTGFRRGGKQRSSLPVVRTPSKTLERPLGLVFLQYRNETKRALLPNEITSIDTVKALFVRSFPKQLTMEYLDSPHVKVYIHDSNKDMFYELEDLRSHLRDIRDRSVLRLFESSDGVAGMPGPMGVPGGGGGIPPHWEDQSYFSEPEFDSEYQHQHIHKSKTAKNSTSSSAGYYIGSSSTLPRGGPLLRAYSPAASTVVPGPNATPTQPKPLSTPGGGGVAPAKPLRSYQCGKSPLGTLGGSARFSRDSSVSLYSIPDRLHGESGYMSSPERCSGVGTGSGRYPTGPYSTGSSYEDPYYSQYSGTVTPVIDEEASDTELLEESYSLYGVKPPGRPPSGPPRSPFPPGAPTLPPGGQPYDVTRIRVEHMERQLANLTGLVQKALTHAPHTGSSPRDYLQVPAGRDPYTRSAGAGDEFDKHSSSSSASLPDDSYARTDAKPPKLCKDKSVSFEKSVSFSDEPPDMNSPKQHSPQHAADTKPTKPAIKSSTLPRMSSQERDSRHKPTPPPKPAALAAGQYVYRDLALTPEMYNQLRGLQKKAKDLRQEVRNLRRMSQTQAHTVRETIRDTFITIRAMLLSGGDAAWAAGDAEKIRLSREEDLYKQEMIRLEKDLTELESTVEELRGNVINRKTRVNMSDVENMALILSKSSKTVADLKVRFPSLQEGMKGLLSSEMEKVVREEKFLKEEPERLESALRRCKKLTGTLVTLKRLASVQEQRLPNAASVEAEETPPITPTSAQHSKTAAPVPAERTVVGSTSIIGGGSHSGDTSAPHQQRPENALDALLDELQTFSRPASQLSQVSGMLPSHPATLAELGRSVSQVVQQQQQRPPNISDIGRKGSVDSSTSLAIITGHSNTLRRLHSYPSSSDTDTSPPIARLQVSDGTNVPLQKPPVPERNAELLQLATARRVPPPPPPRTSSRSPLASPTSPQLPPRNPPGTLRRGRANAKNDSGKPPMALPVNATNEEQLQQQQQQQQLQLQQMQQQQQQQQVVPANNILSTSNSSSCESINSQEGLQNKRERQEQLEQRHQELLRKQKALQEQYARLQQLQRNASGLTTVPPAPPHLLKKTGSESNLLAKMGLALSTTSSGSLTSLTTTTKTQEQTLGMTTTTTSTTMTAVTVTPTATTTTATNNSIPAATTGQTTTSKIYETDIL